MVWWQYPWPASLPTPSGGGCCGHCCGLMRCSAGSPLSMAVFCAAAGARPRLAHATAPRLDRAGSVSTSSRPTPRAAGALPSVDAREGRRVAGTKYKFGLAGRRACRAGHFVEPHRCDEAPPHVAHQRGCFFCFRRVHNRPLSILPLLLVLDRHHHTHPAGPKQHTYTPSRCVRVLLQ